MRHNLGPDKIAQMMLINTGENDLKKYKEKYGIPASYKGKKVGQVISMDFEEKSLRDKLQDEFLEDDGCDDSESDGEVSRSGVEQSEDNASEVEDIE